MTLEASVETLLQISLGPVQEFIASARRSRDLFAGSRLLSKAAWAAANYLAKDIGYANLIFPAPKDAQEMRELETIGIPNVILALVPSEQDPQELAEKALQAARAYIQEEARAKLAPYQAKIDFEAALSQVSAMLETYWAFGPIETYATTRDQVTWALGARKNTRNFAPVLWGSDHPKSSLDGSRESVIYRSFSSFRHRIGIREGEELSSVDLLKRLTKEETFPSTVDMALLPFLEGIRADGKERALKEALEELAQLVGAAAKETNTHPVLKGTLLETYSSNLFFESRLAELLEEEGADQERANKAQQVLQEIYRRFGRPYPYYALLRGDGDRMGQAISELKTPEAHCYFSAQLVKFATIAKKIVTEHQGGLIYSGGDDVLAFLPLHTALQCARALSQQFQNLLFEAVPKDSVPTLSIGLIIMHQFDPL